uniref:Uncharacterized protein n=1 Tax=Arundo donax TaxID=35708 RepID=A0A0A9B8U6_ARUDO
MYYAGRLADMASRNAYRQDEPKWLLVKFTSSISYLADYLFVFQLECLENGWRNMFFCRTILQPTTLTEFQCSISYLALYPLPL